VNGLGLALLSVSTNLPLLALLIVTLVLVPVLGLGIVLFPAAVALLRWRTDVERRFAEYAGVRISRPYRPEPPGLRVGGWRRFRWIVTDPATWLDVAWLVPGAISGLVLGLLAFLIPLYGLGGALLVPLWLYVGVDWFGYGVFWPMESIGEAWLSGPQGLVLLLVGLSLAPALCWVHARFARLLLSPTRAAELAIRVRELTVTRADTVDAQAAELRRIERDLHDGAQARLVSLSMSIGMAEELMSRDPAAARQLLVEAKDASIAALVELRHLVRGIHPPVLAERGLDGAIRALALSLPLPVTVDTDLPVRPQTPVESAAYFAVAEALANVTRHSGAQRAWVDLHYHDGTLSIQVGDDGVGGADAGRGTGLHGIERRLAAFDGTMSLSSPTGGPTVVTMELPCALSSPRILPSSGTA
jgi:signal transduction histidine kinase